MIHLDTSKKDWRDVASNMIRNKPSGTRIKYWEGPTDVKPKGLRKQVFEFFMGQYEKGRVHLLQDRGIYIAEVR